MVNVGDGLQVLLVYWCLKNQRQTNWYSFITMSPAVVKCTWGANLLLTPYPPGFHRLAFPTFAKIKPRRVGTNKESVIANNIFTESSRLHFAHLGLIELINLSKILSDTSQYAVCH